METNLLWGGGVWWGVVGCGGMWWGGGVNSCLGNLSPPKKKQKPQ